MRACQLTETNVPQKDLKRPKTSWTLPSRVHLTHTVRFQFDLTLLRAGSFRIVPVRIELGTGLNRIDSSAAIVSDQILQSVLVLRLVVPSVKIKIKIRIIIFQQTNIYQINFLKISKKITNINS